MRADKYEATKWNLRFLELARLVSTWSKDPSTQTGAVIVRPDNTVASVGFNGFPKGMPDDPLLYANRDEKYSRIVHCEVNAVLLAREPVAGYTLYTWPFMSCDRCVVQMIQAGIKTFFAPEATADVITRWGATLKKARNYVFESGGVLYEIHRSENES